MKTFLSIAVVILLSFSIGEALSAHKNKHHNNKHHHSKDETIDLCPRIGKIECRRAPGANVNECASDNDCQKGDSKSTSKCCVNACQDRVCTKPRDGSCPVSTFDPLIMCSPVDPVYYDCRVDSECPGKKKCCSEGPCGVLKCKDSIEERKGGCPEYKYNFTIIQNCKPFNTSNFECRKDSDCKNKAQKCCRNECFLLTCQNATAVKDEKKEKHPPKKDDAKKEAKSGNCPVYTFDPLIQCSPVDPKFWECREDSECTGTKKCCHDGPCAVKKCKDSVEARKNDCPVHKFNYDEIQKCAPFSAANSKCKVDADCKDANQKCCRDSCFNLTCQNSVAAQKKSTQ